MKNKIKKFFMTLWDYICFPFLWLSTRKVEKEFAQMVEEIKAEMKDPKP